MTWAEMEKTAQDHVVCRPMFFKELKAKRKGKIKPINSNTTCHYNNRSLKNIFIIIITTTTTYKFLSCHKVTSSEAVEAQVRSLLSAIISHVKQASFKPRVEGVSSTISAPSSRQQVPNDRNHAGLSWFSWKTGQQRSAG